MRAALRAFALITVFVLASLPPSALAQPAPPPDQQQPAYAPGELANAGQRFFGTVSRGLATVIENAVSTWGLPNGYVLGEEAAGAFFGGLRYGEGVLYTKNAGDLKVFWQGPTLGWDFGGDGARTMMLVYGLPATEAIYQRFAGIAGSAIYRRLRDDSLDGERHCPGADPVGCWVAIGSQRRLFEIHAAVDLEPVLTSDRGRPPRQPKGAGPNRFMARESLA
jgi:hypothetical protein